MKKKLTEMGAGAAAGGAPLNSSGSGAIAGLGVGPEGEPGVDNSKRKKKLPSPVLADPLRRKAPKMVVKEHGVYGGRDTFIVEHEVFMETKTIFRSGVRWQNLELSEDVATAGKRRGPLVIQDELTKEVLFLKH